MKNMYVPLLAAAASFLLTIILMPLIIRLSHKFKWYDIPDKRKIHKGLIPRLGGVGIFISLIVISLVFSGIMSSASGKPGLIHVKYLPIFLGFLIIHIMGLFDDFRNLGAIPKLFIQSIAALCITCSGFIIKSIPLPYFGTINMGILAYPITILWIVGISNAINLTDGMDGLAATISAFAALAMGIISLLQGQISTALLAFVLFGGITGFLIYNLPPAKIFMGDSGSLLLGFSLAVLPLMGISKTASIGTLIVPITLLTIPIIDTLTAIIRRIKKNRSIISPDKEHIHHKLLDMGFSEKKILTIICFLCLYLSIVAITSVIMPKEANVYLIIVVWTGSMIGYYFLDIIKSKKTSQTNINSEDSFKQKRDKTSA